MQERLFKILAYAQISRNSVIENDEPLYKTTVDHIDGDKSNNCANNLRWLSKSDNTKEYWKKQRKEAEANELI